VKVKFLKIVAFKGMLRKFLNRVAVYIEDIPPYAYLKHFFRFFRVSVIVDSYYWKEGISTYTVDLSSRYNFYINKYKFSH
jgi:hypothetical protein